MVYSVSLVSGRLKHHRKSVDVFEATSFVCKIINDRLLYGNETPFSLTIHGYVERKKKTDY